jgi:hypothetical protein
MVRFLTCWVRNPRGDLARLLLGGAKDLVRMLSLSVIAGATMSGRFRRPVADAKGVLGGEEGPSDTWSKFLQVICSGLFSSRE